MENLHLEYPDNNAIEHAYKSLTKTGRVILTVHLTVLDAAVKKLEDTGFCAIMVEPFTEKDVSSKIIAYKGKQGPCYDTGRKVIYKGVALAAIDDDNHLLIAGKETPVCEKTAAVYAFPPYQQFIRQIEASDGLLDKITNDPVLFECNTFEENLDELYDMLKGKPVANDRCLLFYPGPFRFLILDDGAIIRRGKMNNVPLSRKHILIQKEGLIVADFGESPKPAYFQNAYRQSGPKYFLEQERAENIRSGADTTDLSFLSKLQTPLKERLIKVIGQQKKYFILTGSEPKDKFGCCPSLEVEEANKLVQAGILSSYAQPVPEGTCPVTTYTFKDEMHVEDDTIQFTPDDKIRSAVLSQLIRKDSTTIRNALKWILLAFVMTSLAILVSRILEKSSNQQNASLFEQLKPASETQVMIVLFHFRARCEICLNMEQYTRDFLRDFNANRDESKAVRFMLATIDDDRYADLVKRFNLYSSTLLLVEFDHGQEKQVKVLNNAWQLYRDKPAFFELLEEELITFASLSDE